jgi:cell division protein ZapE
VSAVPTPSETYAQGVQRGRWQDDPAQRKALWELDRIHAGLSSAPAHGLFARFRRRLQGRQSVPGVYLWGGVGRGKTFLIDLLFSAVPHARKQRQHFHRFMSEVHARLRELPNRSDPLADVADGLAEQVDLLCLDEFFVSDIGDAMILARLLEHLFARDVCLVTTSNTAPDNLYRDGLQRERFLPAIELLKAHCVVHPIDSAIDYRLRTLQQARVYVTPLGYEADDALLRTWDALTADEATDTSPLRINDRAITFRRRSEGAIWFDFEALCDGPRSVADYIELARDFHTVFVSNIPALDATHDNAARRFVHLVDEFYDRAVNLIVSAAEPVLALYQGERLRHEFARTGSRLIEMQSEDYLARPHQP